MKRIHKIIAATTGALALAAVTAVTAAPNSGFAGCDGTGPGAGAGGRMGMMHGGMGPGMGQGGMRGGGGLGMMSEASLAQLKTDLAITAAQEAAWQAFAGKAAEQAAQMQTLREQHRAAGVPTTAPEQMSLRIGHMTQRLASMQAMNTALTDLYAVLTPEQRKLADQSMARMGGRGQGYQRGQRS